MCKDENLEEWMKRVRAEAEKWEYQEQDRQIKEQFIYGLDNEGIQAKIVNEIRAKDETDSVTSEQVLMLAKQEEASLIQMGETGQTNTCRYCGSNHPPRRCPAYGVTYGECSRVNHYNAVGRAPRQRQSRQEEQDTGQNNKVKNKQFSHNYNYVKTGLETKISTTSFTIVYI